MKKLKAEVQIEDRFIYIIDEAAFLFSIRLTNKLLIDLFVYYFLINGKVTSLPKIIKYFKRSKDSF